MISSRAVCPAACHAVTAAPAQHVLLHGCEDSCWCPAAWIVVILLTNGDFREMPEHCHEKGRQYIATVAGLLFSFTFGFVLEVLLIWSGCQGEPFWTWYPWPPLATSRSEGAALLSAATVQPGAGDLWGEAVQFADIVTAPSPNQAADPSDVALIDAGAPLEISKRHAMPVLLCIRLGNLCSELVFTGGCTSAGHQHNRARLHSECGA